MDAEDHPPLELGSGGLRQQLCSLRCGIHPVSGLRLEEPKYLDGTSAEPRHTYLRLEGKAQLEVDEKFVRYIPMSFPPAREVQLAEGKTVAERTTFQNAKIKEENTENIFNL